MPSALASSIQAGLAESAKELAKLKGLWTPKGYLCWTCRRPAAYDPSLHCEQCRDRHREARLRRIQEEQHEPPEDRRWRLLEHNVEHDARLTPEVAQSLRRQAGELPSATPQRMAALDAAYDRRFAGARQQPGRRYRPTNGYAQNPFDD